MLSPLLSRLNPSALAAVLSLPALAGVRACCPPEEAHLILHDECSGSWMPLNNHFQAASTRPYREGLLFQFGDYEGSNFHFNSIELHKQDGTVVVLDGTTDFHWVNITSASASVSSSATSAPISDDEGFHLFPNCHASYQTACDPLLNVPDASRKWCETTDTTCTTVQPLEMKCLRGRRLHSDLTPKSILTYWQGDKGYAVSAEQGGEEHNIYSFTFHDEFQVTVYKPDPSASCPALQWNPPTVFPEGEIVRIEVHGGTATGPPNHSGHRDPPW